MTREQPLVSVVIPAYNHEHLVERAIRSVFDQTYDPIELIVVDDGSTDATLAAIRRVHDEERCKFQIIGKANGGVASALNAGIAAARGAFIAILASDDWFLPDKLARQVRMFADGGPLMGMVHANGFERVEGQPDGTAVDLRGSYRPAEGLCFEALVAREVTAVASSVMVRRTVFDEVGGFDETLVGEDLDFYAAVAARGYTIGFDPDPLMVKSASQNSLGSKVELFFNDPFLTLSKYRDRFSLARYRSMEDGFYGGMGRAAAGVGKVQMSWRAYARLARRQRSPLPMVEFGLRNGRHLILTTVPSSWRARLRKWRARKRSVVAG